MNLNYKIRANKFRAKKSLGQNFLVDENIIDFIANLANADDEILEIGAGLGFVTERLVQIAKNVVALEIDREAIKVLKQNLSGYSNFKLIEQDILKTDITKLPFSSNKIKVIANIPYYITSPILVHLLGEIDDINYPTRNMISEINLMVQLEVANRIVATENSPNKEYGQLSILSQMYSDVEIIKFVPKSAFSPSPKVDSAIVKFKINNEPKCPIGPLLKKTIKAIFSTRRKNIKNSLKNYGFIEVEKALSKVGIDVNERGEKLSLDNIYNLSIALGEYNK